MIENQSTIFSSQGTNLIQGPSSMINISPQFDSGFHYQNLYREEAGMRNPPRDSSGIHSAETANNQLDDTNLLIEQGVNLKHNSIFANELTSHEQQCFIANNSKHAVDEHCEANGLMIMPEPLSWLPLQILNANTENQSLHPYHVLHEPTQQDFETQSPTYVQHWGWFRPNGG